MKLYATVYEGRGNWAVHELESNELKKLGTSRTTNPMVTLYKSGRGHYGSIYHRTQLYKSEEDAWGSFKKDGSVAPISYEELQELGVC